MRPDKLDKYPEWLKLGTSTETGYLNQLEGLRLQAIFQLLLMKGAEVRLLNRGEFDEF